MKTLQKTATMLTITALISYAMPSFAVDVVVNDPKTGQPIAPPAPTLAQITKPSDSQLSQANQQLLTKNAELQREIDSLNAQVGVLTHDFSGQLFIYGAFTALLSFIAGAVLSFFVLGRKRGW
ncbi:hypothetical protein [Faucicola boevrei]|uniref:hypothetical protein n=1 Tax=Faucicola boevrei TaxID=346665 RepID=UPI00035D63F9|nr:hypothetical protein [Moraxella boevrei]